jgi:5-methylcytosine-specific restriction endonuclease McrA
MADAPDSTIRACKHCKIEKSVEVFPRPKIGNAYTCFDCLNAARRKRYAARQGQYLKHDTDAQREKRRAVSKASYGRYFWEPSWLHETPSKTCGRCKIELPANPAWFRLRTNSPSGLHSWCRSCEARRYDENKAAILAVQRDYRRNRLESEPEKMRAVAQAWKENNRDRMKASFQRWREQNLELARARQVSYENRRRAQKRGSTGQFTNQDVEKMLAAQKGRCWYCSKKMNTYHVEHRIPLARGGSNHPNNLVLACPPCNFSKGVKMPWELKIPRLL